MQHHKKTIMFTTFSQHSHRAQEPHPSIPEFGGQEYSINIESLPHIY